MVEHRSPKPSVVSSNLTAPAKTKPPLQAVFLWHSGRLMRTHKKWFDHKRKADASMPVSFANERCGGVANLTALAIQDKGAEKRLFSLYIKYLA